MKKAENLGEIPHIAHAMRQMLRGLDYSVKDDGVVIPATNLGAAGFPIFGRFESYDPQELPSTFVSKEPVPISREIITGVFERVLASEGCSREDIESYVDSTIQDQKAILEGPKFEAYRSNLEMVLNKSFGVEIK